MVQFSRLGLSVVGGFTCKAVNTGSWSPLTLIHHRPSCYKSFYNKLHKALWCLNIYSSLRFPRGLFSVRVPAALSHVKRLQTSYLAVRLKGLVVWRSPPQEEHTGRKRPRMSTSPHIITSPRRNPPLVG